MKVDTEIKKIIEEQFYGWEQTSQGDWERYMKGGKTKTIFNTYENKERNLLLKEKISEDRGGGGKSFICWYEIYKGTLLINKNIMVMESDKEESSLIFDCFEDGDNWYDGLWRLGLFKVEKELKQYVDKCNKKIEEYKSIIKRIERNIEEFNKY
jgi:hypothetical protein